MAQTVEAPVRMFESGTTIAAFLRVKLAAGVLAVAGAEDVGIGTTEVNSVDDDLVGVRMWNAQGTRKMVAAGAITAGANVYGAASGKIDDVQNGNPVGIALEAASGNNSIIEVLPATKQLRVVGGEVTLDGTNPTPVTTGLAAVVSAVVSLKAAATPGDDPTSFSVDFGGVLTAGLLNIYAYKTNGTDPTLVASTDSAAVVSWVAVGY